MEIRDPETGGRVIERVLMREEAFSGEDLDTAPDFMAVPAKGYDLKGGFEKQILLEPSPVNGTHTLDDALWFVNVPNMVRANANVVDVLPTLMDLLGLDAPQSVDGRVIKEGQ